VSTEQLRARVPKTPDVGRQNGISGFDLYTEVESVAYPAA
jgi:hypothetical protein